MFLLTDALLILLDDVTNGLVVFPAMIKSQMDQELPFMAMESIIMKLVHQGVSRQEAHERIRVLSLETVNAMKMEGSQVGLSSKYCLPCLGFCHSHKTFPTNQRSQKH